jgi:hypothetical protein
MRKRLSLLIRGAAGMAGMAAAAAIPVATPVSGPVVNPLEHLQGIEVPVCSPLGTAAFAPAPPSIPANPAQHPAQARLTAHGAMLAGMQIAFNPPAHAGLSVAGPVAGPNGAYAALGSAPASAQAARAEYAALPATAPGQAARADYAALSLHAMTLGAPPTYGVAQSQTPVTAGANATQMPVAHSTGVPEVDSFFGCESAEPWAYSVAGMYANLARAAKARGDEAAYVKLVNQYLQMVEQGELRKTMAPRRR